MILHWRLYHLSHPMISKKECRKRPRPWRNSLGVSVNQQISIIHSLTWRWENKTCLLTTCLYMYHVTTYMYHVTIYMYHVTMYMYHVTTYTTAWHFNKILREQSRVGKKLVFTHTSRIKWHKSSMYLLIDGLRSIFLCWIQYLVILRLI